MKNYEVLTLNLRPFAIVKNMLVIIEVFYG